MKSSVNVYFILLVFIFVLYKKNRKEIKSKKVDIKENFATNKELKRQKYKSGKYTDTFRFYKNNNNNNPKCESNLIGDYLPGLGNQDPKWANVHNIESQPYDALFKGRAAAEGEGQSIDHPFADDGSTVEHRCKAQYAIYLDERFPQKPYASLNRLDYKDKGELDDTEFSLSYKNNIHEKHKLEDYIVVPLPNIKVDANGEKQLSDEPIYVLLRYKDKPINANWTSEDVSHTGYCNNYVNCSGNMLDHSNPKCFDVQAKYDKEKRLYKYYQNGTQIA